MPQSSLKSFGGVGKPHTERRLYPRVAVELPLGIDVGGDRPPLPARALDVGVGGVRVVCARYFELFARVHVLMEVALTTREGDAVIERVATPAAVVWIVPDEEGPEDTEYEVALRFTRLTAADERALGLFQLQQLLYDAQARLL